MQIVGTRGFYRLTKLIRRYTFAINPFSRFFFLVLAAAIFTRRTAAEIVRSLIFPCVVYLYIVSS